MILHEIVGKDDEYYTPIYAIEPLLKYLPQDGNKTIWCPFDIDKSNYVKVFRERGFNVLNTHISDGNDFLKIHNEFVKDKKIDYIISNPPFSLKSEVFEILFRLKIPFAMLVGVVGLFESQRRYNVFSRNEFECMYFSKRVSFIKFKDGVRVKSNPPFSSIYLCHKILPKQIVFEEIIKD